MEGSNSGGADAFDGGAGNQTGRTCVKKFDDDATKNPPPLIPGRSISKMDVFGVIVSFETGEKLFSSIQMSAFE